MMQNQDPEIQAKLVAMQKNMNDGTPSTTTTSQVSQPIAAPNLSLVSSSKSTLKPKVLSSDGRSKSTEEPVPAV